jgi:ribosomal protein S27AE
VRSQKDNPDNLQFLPTFAPKILSSRKRFKDVALESRCLTEIMKETDREDIPYLLPSEFYEVEASLRNKLLKFRFQNHGTVDIQKAQKLKTVKVEDRLKQAVSSFVVLFANNEEVYEGFLDFLVSYNAELVEERADTIEGAIIHAISEITKRTLHTVPHTDVLNDRNVLFTKEDLEWVNITATDIAEHLKENNGLQDVTSRGVGRRLKTLGITSKRGGKGNERRRYLDLKERSLAKLIKKYIPSSVDEMDVKADKDVCMGDRGGTIKPYSPVVKATCEQCGEERFLDHEWEDGEQKRLICSKCASELKQEEDEPPKVKAGISLGHGIEYEKIGGEKQ